jgi:hypothetical protein
MCLSGLFKSLVFLISLAAAGRAAEYSTDVLGFTSDPSNLFAHARFGFGFSFSRIDAVGLEIVVPTGLDGGVCTGSSCTFWSVDFAIYEWNHPVDFGMVAASPSVSFDPKVLNAAISYVIAGRPTEMPLFPPNPRIDPDTMQFSSDPWPSFLFSGAGEIGMQKLTSTACNLNCTGSSTYLSANTGVASVRLTIEGNAVPEVSSGAVLVIAAMAAVIARKRAVAMTSDS